MQSFFEEVLHAFYISLLPFSILTLAVTNLTETFFFVIPNIVYSIYFLNLELFSRGTIFCIRF